MPTGDAADPNLFTHEYVIVDQNDQIVATNSTPNFSSLSAGQYYLYSINYDNSESGIVAPMLAPGQSWDAIENYSGCLDISDPYNNCSISVCDEITVVENSILVNPSTGYSTASMEQTYYLVCNGVVQAVDIGATFDLSTIAAAYAGSDCQVVAVNHQPSLPPYVVGDNWSAIAMANCDQSDCWDYLGRDLNIVTVLGIELIEFFGVAEEAYNQLEWETAAEENNQYFALERSIDGIHFEEIYRTAGHGTTSESHQYDFQDFTVREGIAYYRLVAVDFDGNSSTSNTIVLSRELEGIGQIRLYPVPANDHTTLSFESGNKSEGSIFLYSTEGKILHQESIGIHEGTNAFELNTSSLSKGMYTLLISYDQGRSRTTLKLAK